MDKKQLMDAFFDNQKPARVPVGFWHHFVSFHDHYGYEDKAVYDTVVSGQKRFIDEVDPDFLKIMSDGFFGHPAVCRKTIHTADDLAEIKSVGPDHPWITRQVAYAREICEYAGDGMYKLYNIFSPLQYIRLRFEEYDEDFKKFTALFREHPDAMIHAAGKIAKDVNCLVDRLFEETSMDGIYYSVQSVQDKETFTRERHDAVVRPLDLAVLDNIAAHAKRNMIHICGYFGYTNDLSWYRDYPVQAFNWAVYSENISVAEGKKIFDGKPVLGGFDNRPDTLLYTGSDEDIRREVHRILDEAGTAGVGLGADCTIGDNVPVSRLRFIRRVAEEY
ncbi:MAG: uroporphyrinogen decarboxylase [Clostridia bacterium]|nr:uroporphyrinogen decarboxylase [Clostridia bacterium]